MDRQVFLNYAKNLHEAKNRDYGNSFDKTVAKYGFATMCIRLDDKISRLKSLVGKEGKVDESKFDTWLDTFVYSIMSLSYLQAYGNDKDTMKLFNTNVDLFMQTELDFEHLTEAEAVKHANDCNDLLWLCLKVYSVADSTRVAQMLKTIAAYALDMCLTYDESNLNKRYL